MSLLNQNYAPGMGTPIETIENMFLTGRLDLVERTADYLDPTSTDAGSSPTTLIRGGMVLGRITASKNLKPYSATATDGSQYPVGILLNSKNVFDGRSGTTIRTTCEFVRSGRVMVSQVFGLDENARHLLSSRFQWDDERNSLTFPTDIVARTTNYTVTTSDSGRLFTTTGAAGAVTFTLPAVAKGLRFRFFNAVDQNMTVAGPAGTLIVFNNAAATSIAFSTAGNKISACVDVLTNDLGTKYIVMPMGPHTATIA